MPFSLNRDPGGLATWLEPSTKITRYLGPCDQPVQVADEAVHQRCGRRNRKQADISAHLKPEILTKLQRIRDSPSTEQSPISRIFVPGFIRGMKQLSSSIRQYQANLEENP